MSELIVQLLAIVILYIPMIIMGLLCLGGMFWWLMSDVIEYYLKLKAARDKW